MAKAGGGFQPLYATRVSPIRRQPELPIDEARLRPHLRTNQPMTFTPAHTDTDTAFGNYTSSIDTARAKTSLIADPMELRGLPVVGRGVGGVSPGTNPEQATIAKLTKNERAA